MSKRGSKSAISYSERVKPRPPKNKISFEKKIENRDSKLEGLFENLWKTFYGDQYLEGYWGEEYRKAYYIFKNINVEERNRLLLESKNYKKSPILNNPNSKSLITSLKTHLNLPYKSISEIKDIDDISKGEKQEKSKDLLKGDILNKDFKLGSIMILVNSLPDILTNTIYLESKLATDNVTEKRKAIDLIKKGTCFLKYSVDGRILFAPSRFIGYKNNTITNHIKNHPHGSITNSRIVKILGKEPEIDGRTDNEYKAFCKSFDINPNEKGNFGAERKYWDLDKLSTNIYGEIELPEGRKRQVKHLLRERNPRIRQIAISNFLSKNGRLYCEACFFDFEKKYGKTGKDFIECHHTIPISKMMDGHKTKPSDIVLLCSNCHRIIHRNIDWLSLEQLKAIIQDY